MGFDKHFGLLDIISNRNGWQMYNRFIQLSIYFGNNLNTSRKKIKFATGFLKCKVTTLLIKHQKLRLAKLALAGSLLI